MTVEEIRNRFEKNYEGDAFFHIDSKIIKAIADIEFLLDLVDELSMRVAIKEYAEESEDT